MTGVRESWKFDHLTNSGSEWSGVKWASGNTLDYKAGCPGFDSWQETETKSINEISENL